MGIYFPSTFAEWAQDMKASLDAGVEAAKGMGDTALAILTFPHNALAYITGTDASFGEGNSLFSSKFGQYYRRSDAVGIVAENPVYRAADVVGQMAYGLVDLVGLHIPHQIFNEKLGLNIPYFQPVPEDMRGIGRDAGMLLFIGALPVMRAKGRQILKLPEPRKAVPNNFVIPAKAEVQPRIPMRPAWGSIPGVLGIWNNIEAAVRWVESRYVAIQKGGDAEISGSLEAMRKVGRDDIQFLEEQMFETPVAGRALSDLADYGNRFAREALFRQADRIHQMMERHPPQEFGRALRALVRFGHEASIDLMIRLMEQNLDHLEYFISELEFSRWRQGQVHEVAAWRLFLSKVRRMDLSRAAREPFQKDNNLVYEIEKLAEVGHAEAPQILANLEVFTLIRELQNNPSSWITHVLFILARFGNRAAVQVARRYDVSRLREAKIHPREMKEMIEDLSMLGNRGAKDLLVEKGREIKITKIEIDVSGRCWREVSTLWPLAEHGDLWGLNQLDFLARNGDAEAIATLQQLGIRHYRDGVARLNPVDVEAITLLAERGNQAALIFVGSLNTADLIGMANRGSGEALALLTVQGRILEKGEAARYLDRKGHGGRGN